MSEIRLADDQLAQLARLVAAELVQHRTNKPSTALVDANTLAGELGVSRAFIYEHSAELGARRLNGHGRLRFDPAEARSAFEGIAPTTSTVPKPRKRRALAPAGGHVLKSRPRANNGRTA